MPSNCKKHIFKISNICIPHSYSFPWILLQPQLSIKPTLNASLTFFSGTLLFQHSTQKDTFVIVVAKLLPWTFSRDPQAFVATTKSSFLWLEQLASSVSFWVALQEEWNYSWSSIEFPFHDLGAKGFLNLKDGPRPIFVARRRDYW